MEGMRGEELVELLEDVGQSVYHQDFGQCVVWNIGDLCVVLDPTQCDELGTTVRRQTPVYLVLMTWVLQVLVEPFEHPQLGVFCASAIPVARIDWAMLSVQD